MEISGMDGNVWKGRDLLGAVDWHQIVLSEFTKVCTDLGDDRARATVGINPEI